MIFRLPPQFAQCSISKTRLSKRAQLRRAGACTAACTVVSSAGDGTIAARNLAFRASTPWKRMSCSLGAAPGRRGSACLAPR